MRFPEFLLAALAIPVVVLVAACGSSAKPSNSASTGGAAGLRFSDCMRAHGIANFPDPNGSGGGISFKRRSGSDSGPAFNAAESACGHLLPSDQTSASQATRTAKTQMLATSQCMRAHGISGFPDPGTGPPPANAPSASAFEYNDGAYLEVPSSIDAQSPAFKRAALACRFGPPTSPH